MNYTKEEYQWLLQFEKEIEERRRDRDSIEIYFELEKILQGRDIVITGITEQSLN